jgi:catechol 2,3-dioxygenase-like lactoylglutathione lyase family enzyme
MGETIMKSWIIAAGLALAAGAAAAQGAKGPSIAGAGLNVRDMEAEKTWYVEMMGMTVLQTLHRDGKTFEYVLGYQGLDGGVIALLGSTARQPGPNPWGRLILNVPDEKAMGTALAAKGVQGREVLPGVAWFVTDPEGNAIELFTAPKTPLP